MRGEFEKQIKRGWYLSPGWVLVGCRPVLESAGRSKHIIKGAPHPRKLLKYANHRRHRAV